MADQKQQQESPGASFAAPVKKDEKPADVGGSANSDEVRRLAENLPEKDAVQKAYKDALTTEDRQKEAQAYLKAAEESPDALDTPSGYALKESAGESNDTLRGEKYERARAARRWGYEKS
jgi:hypothetical protein